MLLKLLDINLNTKISAEDQILHKEYKKIFDEFLNFLYYFVKGNKVNQEIILQSGYVNKILSNNTFLSLIILRFSSCSIKAM